MREFTAADDTQRGPDARVECLAALLDDVHAHPPGGPHAEQLPDHREEQHADDGDRDLGAPVRQPRAERFGQLGADDRASEEPDHREQPDDGTVAEAADPVGDCGQHDDDVEDIHSGAFILPR
jgi:hypothetical protein